jgi:hypothetical protein
MGFHAVGVRFVKMEILSRAQRWRATVKTQVVVWSGVNRGIGGGKSYN